MGRNRVDLAVTNHACHRRGHLPQCRHGALGPVFLNKSQYAVEQHDDHDGDAVLRLADQAGDDGCCNQHQNHEIGELRRQHGERMAPPGFGQGVGAMLHQPGGSRLGGQSLVQVAAQAGYGVLITQAMPVGLRLFGVVSHADTETTGSANK